MSHARAERVLKAFQAVSRRARDSGLIHQLIEDDVLRGDSVVLAGDRVVNFGLSAYLGLGTDQRLKKAAGRALERFGTSYSSSIAYTSVPLYRDLTERLAAMFEAQVVLAPTTTLAHLAALPVLIRPEDVVVMDTQVHASVKVATQVLEANGVTRMTVPHNDLGQVEAVAAENQDSALVWFLTDGVFSMDGDIAPAAELNALLDRYPNLYVYCDDAHGFSWAGKHGRGAFLARSGWHDRLVISAGLSKSFGATGGVIATVNEGLAELVELTGAPLIFGGPIPPAALGAGVASADIHLSRELEELQSQLTDRIDFVNRFSRDLGLPLTDHARSPIWYHDLGNPGDVIDLLVAVKKSGFFLNGAVFPVVPYGHAGVRFAVTNSHSMQQIEDMMICLQEHRLELFGETEVDVDVDEISETPDPASAAREGTADN